MSLSLRLTGAEVHHVPNPRQEADENELVVANDGFRELGLKPITLAEGLMQDVTEIARRYADRIIGMNGGKVVFDGAPEVLSDADLKTIYGGKDWLQ